MTLSGVYTTINSCGNGKSPIHKIYNNIRLTPKKKRTTKQ